MKKKTLYIICASLLILSILGILFASILIEHNQKYWWTILVSLIVFVVILILTCLTYFPNIEFVCNKCKKQFKPNPIGKKLMASYDILGISYDASMDEIKAKWKKLIVIYHPDKLTNASEKEMKIATKRMAEINLAYQDIVKAKGKK